MKRYVKFLLDFIVKITNYNIYKVSTKYVIYPIFRKRLKIKKPQNTCSIISRGYSFEKIGKDVPPRDDPEKILTKKFQMPYIVVYRLKRHHLSTNLVHCWM